MQFTAKRTVMAVLLACALLAAVVVAVFSAGKDIAADPVSATPGKMTWYGVEGTGACGTKVNAATEELVAVSHELFTAANPNNDWLCKGASLEVTYNGKTLALPVKDKCAHCSAEHIELSKAAFQKLEPDTGRRDVPVTWKLIDTGGGGNTDEYQATQDRQAIPDGTGGNQGGGDTDGGGSTGGNQGGGDTDGGGNTGGNQGGGDVKAPSAPANLRVETVSKNEATVVWDASNDDVGVSGYELHYNGQISLVESPKGTLVGLKPLSHNRITVKARDAAGNLSAGSEFTFFTTD